MLADTTLHSDDVCWLCFAVPLYRSMSVSRGIAAAEVVMEQWVFRIIWPGSFESMHGLPRIVMNLHMEGWSVSSAERADASEFLCAQDLPHSQGQSLTAAVYASACEQRLV